MADDKQSRVKKAHREKRRQIERAMAEELERAGEEMPEDDADVVDIDAVED